MSGVWSSRLVSVALAAGGLCAGLVLGSIGATGCCFCNEPEPIELGTYEIWKADRTELEGGVVEATSEQIEIRFTDDDGADWLIVYRVVDKD